MSTKYTVIENAGGFVEWPIDSQNEKQLDRFKYIMSRGWNIYPVKMKDGWGVVYQRKIREIEGAGFQLTKEEIEEIGAREIEMIDYKEEDYNAR